MSSSLSVSLQSFIQKLEGLKDWPDKVVIMELTAITEKNIGFAEHFAKIIMARLTNEQTHSSYKLPMFYVIDSIMKHVGGPFSVIFGKLFAEGYVKAVFDLHEKDRNRLAFLLNTWDERMFIASDLLNRMKQAMVPGTSPAPSGARPAVHAPVITQQPQPRPQPQMAKQNYPVPSASQQYPRSAISQPHVLSAGAFTLVASAADPAAAMFADLVHNEMVTMLNQMYAEMNVNNPLSLEELATINPSLHAQIRAKAEEAARVIMARRNQAASPVQHGGAQQQQYRTGASPQMYPPATDSVGRKRPSEFSAVGGPAHIPYGRQQYAGASNPQYAQQGRAPQGQAHYSSRFNPGYTNQRRPQASAHYPTAGGQQGGYDGGRLTSTSSAAQAPGGFAQGQGQQLEFAAEEEMDPAGCELDESREEEETEDIHAKYASDFFVNGFLCEVPVVIDVTRVQDLRDVLESRYSPSGESKQDGDHATPPAQAHQMSEGFLEASRIMTQRLSSYLADVQIPPRLPQILFGPLPLSPVYAPTAEALEEQAKRSKAAKEAAVEKPVHKIPMPPFRTEELGRNPEKMVNALYTDKPHQFHEDGLRFSSLTLLKQHTDKHMELKKALQKRKEVREYREWYCTTAQWVTDFSALRLSGEAAPSSSSSGGRGGADGGPGGAEEEYVVPADEHFTRCPVSREVFECLWDEEEGEMMYRNAVKVLVTEAADPVMYAQAQPVPWAIDTPVRYLIVHKLLVLDQWLSSGKAVPLQDACIRYKTTGGATGQQRAERLQSAVGEDEDEEDIFVLLEFSG